MNLQRFNFCYFLKIFLILKLKFHFFCAIGHSDSFKMICSNFTNHRVVKNLKFYRSLYFVLCIVFSGAYSNCILENLVRIYQTGHNGTQSLIKFLFLYVYLQFYMKKNTLRIQNCPILTFYYFEVPNK